MLEHTIEIRVRYQETDGQGRLHHANFFTYFEQGRVELLRSLGKPTFPRWLEPGTDLGSQRSPF